MSRKKYAEVVPEAEQSIREMEALAASKEGQRDAAGRLVPCYPGILRPSIPADWNRSEARAMMRNLIPLNKWFTLAEAADFCHFVKDGGEAMRTLIERMAWYGWRWKSDGVIYELETAIQYKQSVRLDYNISTPGGSLVVGFLRITTE